MAAMLVSLTMDANEKSLVHGTPMAATMSRENQKYSLKYQIEKV
jgi:hypothetical protein